MKIPLNELRQLIREAVENAYDTLGVSKIATKDDVKKALKKLAAQYHIDKLQHLPPTEKAAAEEKFKDITQAAGILLNDKLRARHDAQLRSPRPTQGGTQTPSYDDIMNAWRAQGYGRPVQPKPQPKPRSDESSWQRFIYVGEGSCKFWSIRSSGGTVEVQWGRIGTQKQQKKTYSLTHRKLWKFIQSKTRTQRRKGYIKVDSIPQSEREANAMWKSVTGKDPAPKKSKTDKSMSFEDALQALAEGQLVVATYPEGWKNIDGKAYQEEYFWYVDNTVYIDVKDSRKNPASAQAKFKVMGADNVYTSFDVLADVFGEQSHGAISYNVGEESVTKDKQAPANQPNEKPYKVYKTPSGPVIRYKTKLYKPSKPETKFRPNDKPFISQDSSGRIRVKDPNSDHTQDWETNEAVRAIINTVVVEHIVKSAFDQ